MENCGGKIFDFSLITWRVWGILVYVCKWVSQFVGQGLAPAVSPITHIGNGWSLYKSQSDL